MLGCGCTEISTAAYPYLPGLSVSVEVGVSWLHRHKAFNWCVFGVAWLNSFSCAWMQFL